MKKNNQVVEQKYSSFDTNMIEQNISSYAENAYLEYAMSVVKGRAIPSVEDGLKPVHRRILYAMFREGMTHNSVHKKSARVVGNVLGLYHPHGDQSVYEALVRQAQHFSVRYPLVDGQGNFGSRDGDTAASMRYTEAKLSAITQLYLEEIRDNCVDFSPNYDGTETEPVYLPARIPFVLLNGNPGIAVGMATDIPCHNIKEVIEATIFCLENSKYDLTNVLQFIKGPDYPTGAQIISSYDDIYKLYNEGRGSIRVRSKYKIENEGTKNWKVVFYEIPNSVSVKKLMEEIDSLMNPEDRTKKDAKGNVKRISQEQARLKVLFGGLISKFTDASDKNNPVRLVVEPKSYKQDPQELIHSLLGYTSLETNIPANFVVVGRDGLPVQKSLIEIIAEWIDFRIETVDRRVRYHLQKIADRLHILEGRRIILTNIDKVIQIIKNSDEPKIDLMNEFGLTDIQATDVLELKLRQIGKLEIESILKEIAELTKKQDELNKIIESEKSIKKQIVKELKADLSKFSDDRVTQVIEAERTDVSKIEAKVSQITQEDVTLAVSEKSWVKVVKGLKPSSEISFKEGDSTSIVFNCKNTDTLAIFDVDGKVYNYPLNDISKDGTPINTLAQISSKVSLACPINKDHKYLIAQTKGYGFIVTGDNLSTRQKAGKDLVSVIKDSEIIQPLYFNASENISEIYLSIVTTENKVLFYTLDSISEISKGKGVQLVSLPSSELVKNIKLVRKGETIEFSCLSKNKKEEKLVLDYDKITTMVKGRATKGSFLPIKDKMSEITIVS